MREKLLDAVQSCSVRKTSRMTLSFPANFCSDTTASAQRYGRGKNNGQEIPVDETTTEGEKQ